MNKLFGILLLFFGITIISHQQILASNLINNDADSKKTMNSSNDGVNENVSIIPLGESENLASLSEEEFGTNYFYYSQWTWSESTLEMLDKSSAFIFRSKKSSEIEELRVLVSINDKGKLIGYKVLNEEADKGLIERVGYVLRKMPRAIPVPGFDNYEGMNFELMIGS
ncbi:hypothetical protein [Aquiflexum lacus]|uniref:hypothetical protein n=1 Tax=Aquiflexum lacus TaxID=2483805 RepID=UPI001894E497|nr:hypothetical protein [Aquiflexum lacus]